LYRILVVVVPREKKQIFKSVGGNITGSGSKSANKTSISVPDPKIGIRVEKDILIRIRIETIADPTHSSQPLCYKI
jgi:hypothetical protein